MAGKRVAKSIVNPKDVEYFLNITENDITTTFIMETFGLINGNRRFNPYDEITIPPGTYGTTKKNKEAFLTTVGIWIFNKYFIEQELFDIFHYINENLDSGKLKAIESKLSYALLEDKITVDQLSNYLMKTQKCMFYCNILSPGFTLNMITSSKKIKKVKDELVKKYKEEIKNGDEVIANKMEKELINYAKELLNDDPSMDLFLSGAGGDFENNFKNIFLMKGAIRNFDPTAKQEYHVSISNYLDGISKEEYSLFADSLAMGPYSRSHKTEIGGYWEKLFRDAFQHITLLPAGSDCHTDGYIEETLTSKNIDGFMYMYIIEGDDLVELTSDIKDKYINKKVKLRFPNKCKAIHGGICNKCMGNLYYRLGIENIGILLTVIPSKLKLIAMKAFHDSTVRLFEMDAMKAFSIEN